jgi:lipid-A-disaccharide synthase
MPPIDILILSNGPGEVTTWVRPVVQALRQQLGEDRSQIRISVILSPCPNATGKEIDIILSYPQVDRVQPAQYFWHFLLWGKTQENWDWRSQGVVIFLGGDQFFPVVIGKRLGYSTVVYAEWEARWHAFIDRFAVMKPEVAAKVAPKYAHKFTVVGDLMAEVQQHEKNQQNYFTTELIGLLPGSKPAKLLQGVPFTLAVAEYIYTERMQTKFAIFVAPTLDLQVLANFAAPQKNPFVKIFGSPKAELLDTQPPVLKTTSGLTIELVTRNPAYDILSQCCLCLTTVGANTAELGCLAVPMIVLLPTQQLDAMKAWDGLPGLLANLPGIGSTFAKITNWLFLKRKALLAWPNIWAQQMIVPELKGQLQPAEVAKMVLDYLDHPEKLEQMRLKLQSIRGKAGAARKIAQLVREEIETKQNKRNS